MVHGRILVRTRTRGGLICSCFNLAMPVERIRCIAYRDTNLPRELGHSRPHPSEPIELC